MRLSKEIALMGLVLILGGCGEYHTTRGLELVPVDGSFVAHYDTTLFKVSFDVQKCAQDEPDSECEIPFELFIRALRDSVDYIKPDSLRLRGPGVDTVFVLDTTDGPGFTWSEQRTSGSSESDDYFSRMHLWTGVNMRGHDGDTLTYSYAGQVLWINGRIDTLRFSAAFRVRPFRERLYHGL